MKGEHMEKMRLTCPFTGIEFQAFKEPKTHKLYFANPLTHEMVSAKWDKVANTYVIPAEMFRFVETCTTVEAMEILNVSRQRISQIVNDNVIPSHIVNNQPVFILSDVLQYKENKKPGRPRKVD